MSTCDGFPLDICRFTLILGHLSLGLAGLTFVLHFRKPSVPRDRLLMLFPLVYLVGHLYIYIAKFDIYFTVDANGLSAEGLAVGNLIVVVMALVASVAITLLSHPTEPARPRLDASS